MNETVHDPRAPADVDDRFAESSAAGRMRGAAPGLRLPTHWGWMLALGILFIALGTLALAAPALLTLTTVLLFGVLLLVGGGVQLAHAFRCGGWKCAAMHLLIGAVYAVAGLIAVIDPVLSSVTLTLVLGVALILTGILRIVMGFQARGSRGWGWLVGAGTLSMILGSLVLVQWPASSIWFIGLVVAIELIFHGWSYVFLALDARRARRRTDAGTPIEGA